MTDKSASVEQTFEYFLFFTPIPIYQIEIYPFDFVKKKLFVSLGNTFSAFFHFRRFVALFSLLENVEFFRAYYKISQ